MTHYRLTLTKGRGPKMKMIAERHSYSKTPPSGWWRSVKLLGSSIHVRVCWTPDEACEALNGGERIPGAIALGIEVARSLSKKNPPHTPTPSPEESER